MFPIGQGLYSTGLKRFVVEVFYSFIFLIMIKNIGDPGIIENIYMHLFQRWWLIL